MVRFTREDDIMEGQPLITVVTLTTEAAPLPATAMVGRNVLLIHNSSNVDITLCNDDGTGTFTIEPGDKQMFRVKNSEPLIYAKVAAATADIEIMEWA